MSPNYPHLLLNHLPLFSLAFGIVLLLISLIKANHTLRLTALITLVFGALITIPAVLSGDEAEHFVEDLAGVSEYYLHEHEELGEVALTVNLVAGSLALLGLFAGTFLQQYQKFIDIITLVAAIIGLAFTVITAKHGGQIRRPEMWDPVELKPQQASNSYDMD